MGLVRSARSVPRDQVGVAPDVRVPAPQHDLIAALRRHPRSERGIRSEWLRAYARSPRQHDLIAAPRRQPRNERGIRSEWLRPYTWRLGSTT